MNFNKIILFIFNKMNLGKRHTQAWVESRSTVNYTGFPKEPLGKNGKVSQ